MIYLGIDPGAKGGIAGLFEDGGVYCFRSLPMDQERDVWELISRKLENSCCVVVLERVSGYIPSQKGEGQPGSSMFNFGQSYGLLRGMLVARGFVEGSNLHTVTPHSWQKGLEIPTRGKSESKTAWKNRLKAEAQSRFPNLKITLATADALLIAAYCRNTYRQE